jgi:formate/nitrite transporter FocA (FNT family)
VRAAPRPGLTLTPRRAARVGGLFIALLLRFSTIADGAPMAEMVASVEHKLAYVTDGPGGWVDLLVRAVLCNFCINVAMLLVYNGLIKDDLTKCLVMITSVFIFAFLGLEHSVANTVLFSIVGLQEGLDVAAAAGNVGIALIGNFIGGGLLIGLYYAYVNDDAQWLRQQGRATSTPDDPGRPPRGQR